MSSLLLKKFFWLGEKKPRWLFCQNGQVVASGMDDIPHAFLQSKIIDCQGAHLIPALTDTHIHLHMLGEKKLRLDLSQCQNKTQLLQKLAEWRKQNPSQSHLLAFGWNENKWSDSILPTHSELESVLENTIAVLTKSDGHAALATRATFHAAKIPVPENPAVKELEYEQLRSRLPKPSLEYYRHALAIAQNELLSLGIGAAHESAANNILLQSFRSAAKDKKLPLYIAAAYYPDLNDPQETAGEPWSINNHFWLYGKKFFLDGSFSSRTAANFTKYLDTQSLANFLIQPTDLKARLSEAIKNNFVPLVHAIGEKAVMECLECFQNIQPAAKRLRLEHAELFQPSAALLAKTIPGLVIGTQPLHAHSDLPLLKKILSEESFKNISPWKTQWHSAILCGGSDAPMDFCSPFLGMAKACSHPLLTEESLDRYSAFALYSENTFAAMNLAPLWGSLKPGQLANFSLLDRDPILCRLEDLASTKVLAMYLDGEKAWGTFPPN